MTLIEKIIKSRSFILLDELSGNQFKFQDLKDISWLDNSRNLVFCYLDNTHFSISFLIKSLASNNVLVLLSIGLSNELKNNLELIYTPNYIFDSSRQDIKNYYLLDDSLFSKIERVFPDINPLIKVLLSTSGTTGSPKFVKLSETNLISNAESISDYLPIKSTDVVPLNLPIYYSYGLSVLTSNAIKGATLSAGVADVLSKEFWVNFEKYQYSTFAGVPFIYEMLDRIGFTNKKLPSLRYFTQAGGKLRDSLVKKYGEYALINKKSFFVMYGQTEATARMSFLHPDELLNHIGSIGKVIPRGNFTIEENTSELIYTGDNVFGGYANSLNDLKYFDLTKTLNTGDLARVDDDGYYFIIGRSKRFSKIYGNRINLDELELTIAMQFDYNLPCIGWEDKLILIFSDNQDINSQDVINFISRYYKLHSSSFKIISIKSKPLTPNGKVDYTALIREYDIR